jgi:hypothetical protein
VHEGLSTSDLEDRPTERLLVNGLDATDTSLR